MSDTIQITLPPLPPVSDDEERILELTITVRPKRKAPDASRSDASYAIKRTKREEDEVIDSLVNEVAKLKQEIAVISPHVFVPAPRRTEKQLIDAGRCPFCHYAEYNCVCDD